MRRRPGQKEVRYAHLLAGEPQMPEDDSEQPIIHSASALEARVTKLEEELAEMKTAFEKLMKELMG